jgi:hypothetical protein
MSLKSWLEEKTKVSISKLKHSFAKKFPDSPLLPMLMTLPDKIDTSELIGQSLILLEILDTESANNLNLQRKSKKVNK